MALKTSHRDIGRPLDSSFLIFDIPELLKQIKSEEDWSKEPRNAIILHKSHGMRIVLVAMHAGTAIQPHTADYPISLQVVEGSLKFNAGSKSATLRQGQMLTLHEGIRHDIKAPEESAFLLTLATGEDHPAES